MLETAKKTILFGIGALSFSKEKGEKLVKELVDKGKLTTGEATMMVEGIIKKGEEEKAALRVLLQEELEKLQKNLGFLTKEDLSVLERRLQFLEEKINALTK